ncbi:MAG: hypothetical protein ACREAZ_12165 [Nitrososphaera sp.]
MLRIRANPEIKVSIAVIFTIASVLLIFGIWTIVRPSPDNDDDPRLFYIDWLGTQANIEPFGVVGHSFYATKGQLIEVRVSQPGYDPLLPLDPSMSVTFSDPDGNFLIDQKTVEATNTVLLIEQTGTYHIEVTNNQDQQLNIGINVYSVERKAVDHFEAFGSMLSLMSIPIFLLGVWLFVTRSAKQATGTRA